MSPTRRWIIAIVMAVVLLAVFVPVFYVGYALGGMATDSCSNLPGQAFLWIEVLWPIVLVATYLFGVHILRIPSRPLCMTLSADMSVCGVSAAIATGAACRAKKDSGAPRCSPAKVACSPCAPAATRRVRYS